MLSYMYIARLIPCFMRSVDAKCANLMVQNKIVRVYLLYYVCIAVFTSDAGLRARSRYSGGPATGHLDTWFSWFPCVYKQMLRLILFLSFRRVLNVIYSFLGNSPASEF